jgi:hypothetical protein
MEGGFRIMDVGPYTCMPRLWAYDDTVGAWRPLFEFDVPEDDDPERKEEG